MILFCSETVHKKNCFLLTFFFFCWYILKTKPSLLKDLGQKNLYNMFGSKKMLMRKGKTMLKKKVFIFN